MSNKSLSSSNDFIDGVQALEEMTKVMQQIVNEYEEDGYSMPKINIKECATHVLVDIEMPGIPKRNINIEVEPTSLEVRGCTNEEKIVHNDLDLFSIKKERILGKFKRYIELPCKIDVTKVNASYEDGVLYVELTKPDETENKSKRQIKLY